jgi:hypothetical protein
MWMVHHSRVPPRIQSTARALALRRRAARRRHARRSSSRTAAPALETRRPPRMRALPPRLARNGACTRHSSARNRCMLKSSGRTQSHIKVCALFPQTRAAAAARGPPPKQDSWHRPQGKTAKTPVLVMRPTAAPLQHTLSRSGTTRSMHLWAPRRACMRAPPCDAPVRQPKAHARPCS